MTDDVEVPAVPADSSAPEQVETASPASAIESPEEVAAQQARTFTQEELDAAISKRLARERRKWERDTGSRSEDSPAAGGPLNLSDFESPEAYADALAEQKAHRLLKQRETADQLRRIEDSYEERAEAARDKYDDYDQIVGNPSLQITNVMAETIKASDIGPDVAYHLGMNPKEAARIAQLSPFLQAKEIGRLEAKLATAPPVKKTSNAPEPIAPITARTSGASAIDTTDPRSIEKMSTSEWIAAERTRQIKKLEAQQIR